MVADLIVSYLAISTPLFIWGIICGRLRLIGLLLSLIPHAWLVAALREEIWGKGQTMILVSIFVVYGPPTFIGYIIGYFWSNKIRKRKEEQDKEREESERRTGLVRLCNYQA